MFLEQPQGLVDALEDGAVIRFERADPEAVDNVARGHTELQTVNERGTSGLAIGQGRLSSSGLTDRA
jgi:hypothetical protein